MAPSNPTDGTGSPSSGSPAIDRKGAGSVKRARQLLEAGVRPERSSPPVPKPPPILIRNVNQQMKWPLRDSSQQPYPPNHHPRYMTPRGPPPHGPPPQRPPHPSEVPSQVPSPSVYSVRSSQDNGTRPTQSFSHPRPNQPPSRLQTSDDMPASPSSTESTTAGGSITTDELFRRSGCSSTPSVPDVPPFPPPPPEPQYDPRRRTAGLVPPPNARRGQRARRSSVSPIPEENSNPRNTLGSLASSRAMPSSWGSGLAESEILGAYLDVESDSDDGYDSDNHSNPNYDNSETLVRSASLGKRGKPTMRTIQKPGTTSDANAETQSDNTKQDETAAAAGAIVGAIAAGVATDQTTLRPPTPERKRSASTASSDGSAKGVDPEKPPIVQDESVYNEKEENLPMAAPTMSDNRPGGRKPPRLDIGAVRNAEARGSLSSLTDLIRRATKLASNLDRGRTASRADLLDGDDAKPAFGHRYRNSGSLSDILASFPPPGLSTPDESGRQSWPVFFGRSNLRHIEPLSSNEDGPDSNRRRARCCGMPKWLFIFFCMIVLILVVLAIVLPVMLVAVPNAASSDHPTCAQRVPCHNGGVSVSAGNECSCVCSDGYTGPQCTINGDGSCITAEVSNSSMTRNATMGSALPSLFQQSEDKFGIELDPITIMALFSIQNVSCKTENALVSFSQVNTGSSNSSNSRRSLLAGDDDDSSEFASPSVLSEKPTAVMEERAVATMNGIVYDDEGTPKAVKDKDAKATQTTSTSTLPTATPTANSSSSNPSTVVPAVVVEFSRVSVLYILQRTGSLDAAMSAESRIESYLTLTSTGQMGSLEVDSFSLDFSKRTIHRSGE
ncbi:hypothetical protein N7474_005414 [Penicillium riverlandense]|uniref:uncharacterized protein n=1 Tax=Penicillium riverlandense TaxID=1903569 RepID=UPI002549B9FE|nr:uncharacterized protein N7474_005414 [Penicillium riverlandense]KAJ5819823.1 hypothetical protein N7474_005414 [Penicillium riverlandense]